MLCGPAARGRTIVRMPAVRSPRLERLLGGRIDESLTYDQVRGLIPNVAESSDLDFKRDTYGNTDSNRKELCTPLKVTTTSHYESVAARWSAWFWSSPSCVCGPPVSSVVRWLAARCSAALIAHRTTCP